MSQKVTGDYRQEFGELGSLINSADSIEDWYDLYGRLVFREMELADAATGMSEMLEMQKRRLTPSSTNGCAATTKTG